MIKHIPAESVNQALYEGLYHVAYFGLRNESRNGDTMVSPFPVMTTYLHPERRVLVNSKRDANPFFHLFESLWMLAGRNDLAFCQRFVSTFGQFSDDGKTLHGAYGYRWREYFCYDQLEVIIAELKRNPASRRCVLQMWDGGMHDHHVLENDRGPKYPNSDDLRTAISGGKDVPCNTAAYFDTIDGKLNMTVTCRSNDVVLGAFGANAVHFSVLLEYLSVMTGIPMGVYRQFSNNFHVYLNDVLRDKDSICAFADSVLATCPYSTPGVMKTRLYGGGAVQTVPLMDPGSEDAWHADLKGFMAMVDSVPVTEHLADDKFTTNFFRKVVGPMYDTWTLWKLKNFEGARQASLRIVADDWRSAAQDWLSIREMRRAENADV